MGKPIFRQTQMFWELMWEVQFDRDFDPSNCGRSYTYTISAKTGGLFAQEIVGMFMQHPKLEGVPNLGYNRVSGLSSPEQGVQDLKMEMLYTAEWVR